MPVDWATTSLYQRACFSRPAASRIKSAISLGWETSERYPAFTSTVWAFMRFAKKRSTSGKIVSSSFDTA
jgi:hypothetical protein